jgi:DNA primase
MAGKIPPEFIDQLLGRTDIVDIIDKRLALKKAGKDYQACCPFHSEKTPSFTVSPDKQFYHCFGCGAHGSAIGFLMEYEHMGFRDAVEELAQHAGLEMPETATAKPSDDWAPLVATMQHAEQHFRQQLHTHPQAAKALDYLKQRGVSSEIAAEFGLGYAPAAWNGLRQTLGATPQAIQQLVTCGLLIEQNDNRYDRFRDRIMFPIRDRRGRTIGFGGRILGDEKPKYLNSPETPLFHKGRELYGLFEARKAMRQIEQLVIVEGYMDVIALAQFGIRYAVATLGTATTAEHLNSLFRVSRELVFCFDGDRAGRDAAWKALKTALPHAKDGREIRFLFLPESEDPDTLVRKIGGDELERQLRTALHLSEYFFQHLSQGIDMQSIDGRARFADQAKPLLQQLPAGVFRESMIAQLATMVSLPANRIGISPAAPSKRHVIYRGAQQQRMTPVRMAIALLVQAPQLGAQVQHIDNAWKQLPIAGVPLLKQLLELTQSQPNLKTAALLERWRGSDHFSPLNKLAQHQLPGETSDLAQELADTLERLNMQTRELESERLYSKSRPSEMSEEEKSRLKQLLARLP